MQEGIINGLRVAFVTTEEAETCDVIVCVDWTSPPIFRDNLRARCASCRRRVQHRPDVPRRPMKLCTECAAGYVKRH